MSGQADDLYDGHYQTEYKGMPGHEKVLHKTHFSAPGVSMRHTVDNGWVWVEVHPGRWRRVKKDGPNDNPVRHSE
jgi:hypothetical protein